MNNLYARVFVGLLAILFLTSPAEAQLVTLTSTTTSAAVAATDKSVCLTAATGVAVPGVGTRGSTFFIGKEQMRVQSATSTATCFNVVRSSRPVGHASGATVYIGSSSQFYTYNPEGTCTLALIDVRPWINTATGEISDCVSSLWTRINGPATQGTGLTSLGPVSAGNVGVGSALLPFQRVYVGTAATNNMVITPAATSAARVISMADPGGAAGLAYLNSTNAQTITSTTKIGDATTATKALAFSLSGATAAKTATFTFAHTDDRAITFPDDTFTVAGANVRWCGTTGTCANTNKSTTAKILAGTIALDGASPSVGAVTGVSAAFTSSATYSCTGTIGSASANTKVLAINYVSSSAFSFVGPNSATDVVSYVCVGY